MDRNIWSQHTFNSIDWEVPGKALDTFENSAKIFIVKFAHDHLPTRQRHVHRIKRAAHDKCPACIHLTETEWHILSCPNRSIWRNKLLRTLGETTLATHNTHLDLALILLQEIRGALANPQFQRNLNKREPIFRALVNSQNKIGWQHLFKGRFSSQWTQIQPRDGTS